MKNRLKLGSGSDVEIGWEMGAKKCEKVPKRVSKRAPEIDKNREKVTFTVIGRCESFSGVSSGCLLTNFGSFGDDFLMFWGCFLLLLGCFLDDTLCNSYRKECKK